MGKSNNQKGFTLVETLLVILVLAVIGFGGYYVWHTQHKTTTQTVAATTPKSTATKPAAAKTAANPYAGWKSYTLTYEKLALMYPPNWTVVDQSTAAARHDEVTFSATDGFSFTINDGIQNGGDPRSLVSADPVATKYLGNPAYLVFINPRIAQAYGPPTPDASVVGSATLLTDPNNQASFPADKNVIGGPQYNGVNGPEGSYMGIDMGYNGKNNMAIQAAKADTEYKNGELVIQSMHY